MATSVNHIAASLRRKSNRTQAVHIRHEDEVEAMSWFTRFKTRLRHTFEGGAAAVVSGAASVASSEDPSNHHRPHHSHGHINSSNNYIQNSSQPHGTLPTVPHVQYRLEAKRRKPQTTSWIRNLLTCRGRRDAGLAGVGVNPNEQLALYLHWMFRVNFLFLFVVMCMMFFCLVILFAGFITLAGTLDAQCVRIGGEEFGSNDAAFADAFALSWTTFSTVGYGSTAPALGHQNDSGTQCFFINFILTMESLLGVLYSGFCGAILFGKVLRIQSHAQVVFSDPIVIRYGTGVLMGQSNNPDGSSMNGEEDDDDVEGNPKASAPGMPCPVLEFRIVNRLFHEFGGEIMDATLNVVANVDANAAGDPLDGTDLMSSVGGTTSLADSGSEASSLDGSMSGTPRSRDIAQSLGRVFHNMSHPGASNATTRRAVDEDPTARLVSKQVFSKMFIEASDHPFFKRVWLARHILDEHSPILKPRVRKYIAKYNGTWPERFCTAQHIRDALQFNTILVSLNGVSNVSASDVYAQKIYDFVDVNVGYQFVNILYQNNEGGIGVDVGLINDVMEQNGGGGENLILEE